MGKWDDFFAAEDALDAEQAAAKLDIDYKKADAELMKCTEDLANKDADLGKLSQNYSDLQGISIGLAN